MGSFGKSLSRELGKNTGKWVSNKIFGDSYATPHKLIHSRERENARLERAKAKEYREKQKEIELLRKTKEREILKYEKEYAEKEKAIIIKENTKEVYEHNNYIEVIQTVHKDYSKKCDWEYYLKKEEPTYVKTSDEVKDDIIRNVDDDIDKQKQIAKSKVEKSFISLIIGGLYTNKNRWLFKLLGNRRSMTITIIGVFIVLLNIGNLSSILQYSIISILFLFTLFIYIIKLGARDYQRILDLNNLLMSIDKKRDELIKQTLEEQDNIHEIYVKEKEDLSEIKKLAKGVLAKDPRYYTYAINFFNPFDDLKDFGSDLSFSTNEDYIQVDFFVHSNDVIPSKTKKILRKGIEIKEQEIPKSRFNEIYQDYVCSCVLRIAKEIFQLIPKVDNVLIDAKGLILNTATGNYEEKTIVSVDIERKILEQLNFELLDPSDSISNFNNNMNFKKTKGFEPVESLKF